MSKELTLPQALVLLALRDEDGKFMGSWHRIVFGGAIISELFLRGALDLGGKKGDRVKVVDASPTGSVALDHALNLIACAPKPKKVQSWVNSLAGRSQSQKLILQELTEMGALTQEKQKVLVFFNATRWPEANSMYESKLKSEMARVLFTPGTQVDERMGTIICLANLANLLKHNFDREELKANKAHIKTITDSPELAAPAVKSAIQAAQAAVIAATTASTVAAVS